MREQFDAGAIGTGSKWMREQFQYVVCQGSGSKNAGRLAMQNAVYHYSLYKKVNKYGLNHSKLQTRIQLRRSQKYLMGLQKSIQEKRPKKQVFLLLSGGLQVKGNSLQAMTYCVTFAQKKLGNKQLSLTFSHPHSLVFLLQHIHRMT